MKEFEVLSAGSILMTPATDLLYMVVTFQEGGDGWDVQNAWEQPESIQYFILESEEKS